MKHTYKRLKIDLLILDYIDILQASGEREDFIGDVNDNVIIDW